MKALLRITNLLLLLLFSPTLLAAIVLEYQITGIQDPELKNATSRLAAEQKRITVPLTPAIVQRLYSSAPQTILEALQPYGYFKAVITQQKLVQVGKEKWQASFTVQLGPILKITKLDFSATGPAMKIEKFQQLVKDLPLKQGAPLDMTNYNLTKQKLTDLAAQQGFLGAVLTQHAIYIDLEKYTSTVVLHFTSGPQYYFGAVTFTSKDFDPKFLQRYVRFKVGDPYSSDALLKLQQDLSGTIYFQQVAVTPEVQKSHDDYVPIDVYLTPSKSQLYKLGLGYGTDTGVRATATWELRHLTDTGHYFKTYLQASELQTNLQARYVIPGENPVTDQYYIGANIENQNINDNSGTTEKISLGRIDDFHSWQRTLSLNYQFDQYSIHDAPYQHTHLFVPNATFTRSENDNIIFPRNGYSISFNLLGAAEPLLSSSTFLQGEINASYITSPTAKTRWVFRGNLGLTAASDIELIPLSLQFFAGGSQSVRGYSYEELGPGKYLLVASAEFQYQVRDKWFGAIFIDAGNAVNSLSNPEGSFIGPHYPHDINLNQLLKYSFGVGVVWVTPVGPVEVTLAKSLSDAERTPLLQFTMGPGL